MTPACIHRGEKISLCFGKAALIVFACTVHERCTVDKKVKDAACCLGCESYDVAKLPARPSPENKGD